MKHKYGIKIKHNLSFVLIFSLIVLCTAPLAYAKSVPKPQKIYLSVKTKKMVVGKKFQIKVKKVLPYKAVKTVEWRTSNKNIATVSRSGVVKAKKAGVVKITAISKKNKKVKAVCKIIVQKSIKKAVTTKKPAVTQKPTQKPYITPEPTATVTKEPEATSISTVTKEPVATSVSVVTAEPTAAPNSTVIPKPIATPASNLIEKPTAIPIGTAAPEPTNTVTERPTATPVNAATEEPTVTPIGTATKEPTISSAPAVTYIVKFVDYDNTLLKEEKVEAGREAEAPMNPKRIGYIFKGWDKDYSNVNENLVVIATYEKDTTSSIIVGDVVVVSGTKQVQIPVYINSNPGILGMTLAVTYDDKVMTLTDAVNGDTFNNILVFTKANILKNNCKFTWDGEKLTESDIKDGVILLLTFDIFEKATEGDYEIGFYYNSGDIIDANLESIDLELRKGIITIKKDV